MKMVKVYRFSAIVLALIFISATAVVAGDVGTAGTVASGATSGGSTTLAAAGAAAGAATGAAGTGAAGGAVAGGAFAGTTGALVVGGSVVATVGIVGGSSASNSGGQTSTHSH